jgi:nitrite reductase (NO-forming)
MDMMHTFVLDDFNVRTDILKSGSEETIEFGADKAGTFEYFCSVGDHRQKGMVGNLIVE